MKDIIKKVVIYLNVFLIIVSLGAMICSLLASANSKESDIIIESIKQNHLSNLISNFYFDSDQDKKVCKQENFVSKAIFEGTNNGCYCKTLLGQNFYNSTNCYGVNDCVNVNAVHPAYLNTWGGYELCSERDSFDDSKPYNYYDLIDNDYIQDTCFDDKVSCGKIDNLGRQLCVKDKDLCPINYIKVSNVEDHNKSIFKQLQFKNGKYFFYSNKETTGVIPVEFKTSELENICFDPREYHGEKSKFLLEFNWLNRKEECSEFGGEKIKYNKNYNLLDSNIKKDILVENEIYSKLVELPFYSKNSLYKNSYFLYYRNFIGWKSSCLKEKNLHPKIVSEISLSIKDNFYSIKIVKILSIVLFCLSVILIMFVDSSFGDEKKYFGFLIFLILILPFIVSGIVLSSKIKNTSIDLTDCFENNTAILYNYYKDSNYNLEIYVLVVEVFYIISLALYFVIFTSFIAKICYYKEDEKKPELNNELLSIN